MLPDKYALIMVKGKWIGDMSREELVAALAAAVLEIERLQQQNQHERDFLFDTLLGRN